MSYGSMEKIYQKYYDTVQLSITCRFGYYKPIRIGHITLVHKFQNRFPFRGDEHSMLNQLLNVLKKRLFLDYNGAGTAKPLCREPYPPRLGNSGSQ